MKKILKTLFVFIFILIIITQAAGCSLLKSDNGGKNNKTFGSTSSKTGSKISIQLYFPNTDNSALPSQSREITVNDGAVIRAAVEELIKGPDENNMRKPFPEGTKLLGVNLKDNTAVVDFSKEYTNTAGLSEILARASLVNTLTGIAGVRSVHILVEGSELIGPSGMPIGAMERFALDSKGYPVPGVSMTVTLYFGSPDAATVTGEKRNIVVNNGSSVHRAILEELIKGPSGNGVFAFMPTGTKIISVETVNDLCTVNFSKEFVDNANTGTAGEAIIINSIVNSLTELEGTKRIQFLVESEKRGYYIHAAFEDPFVRNEAAIKK